MILLVVLMSQGEGFSQDAPRELQRIQGEVVLDGSSDEAAWDDVDPFPLTMHRPVYEGALTERTEIRVAYDDYYLYASGRFYDSDPSGIHANSLYRDNYMNSDIFNLIVDTFNDKENALWFSTTPAGVRVDRALSNDGNASNLNWDTFWDVAAVQNEEGWFAEMRIPFSSLGFKRQQKEVTIGIITTRYIDRKYEIQMYPGFSQDWPINTPSKAVEFVLRDIVTERPIYFTPYILGGYGQEAVLNDSETDYFSETELIGDIGLDVKFNITHNLTLDATVNTDFAQIEADDEQVNLSRYSLFYPEKRRFFQERSGIFEFGTVGMYGRDRLFHSRTIGIHEGQEVRILGGVRLVGRAGPWDIGALDMQTERCDSLPSENFGVLRLRRQAFNENSYIGGILTTRLGHDGSYNVAYGFDGILRLFKNDYLSLRWSQTFNDGTQDQSSFRFFDASNIVLHWDRRTQIGFHYEVSFTRSGKNFMPGMGYITRQDYHEYSWRFHFDTHTPEPSWIRKYSLCQILGQAAFRNADNSMESGWAEWGTELHWKSGAFLFADAEIWYEDLLETLEFPEDTEIPSGSYTNPRFEGGFGTSPGRLLYARLILVTGPFYDGWRDMIWFTPRWSVSRHFNLSLEYSLNRVRFPERDQRFDAHVVRLRVESAFNTKFSINGFIQYNSISDHISPNIRFRYNFREGNDLWLVYNEGFNTARHEAEPVLPVTDNRTVMMKFTYTLQK